MSQSLPRNIARFLALASVAISGFALAAPPTKQGETAQAAPESRPQQRPQTRRNRERLICADLASTGSRLTRRVCHTATEWQNEGGIPTAE